jgi:hypothetical protein
MPPSVQASNVKHYKGDGTFTEHDTYEGRPHLMVAGPGWEEIADRALEWALAHSGVAGPSGTRRQLNITTFTDHSVRPARAATAASIPAGLIDDRLPVGMQIIGARYDDSGVLTASRAFEQLRPWIDTYELCRQR